MPAGCVALVARCSCCALLASVLVDVAALKQPDVRSVDRSNISSHALLSRALLRSEKTQGGFASTEDACEKCYLDYPAAACYVGICQGDTGEKGKPYSKDDGRCQSQQRQQRQRCEYNGGCSLGRESGNTLVAVAGELAAGAPIVEHGSRK
eukprot:TRINITY_DN37473_c0_g1_i1.p2 TRINITY_DN37473_c0_g1~~TRINITY_DN37473_c0_g1_i1.p2  ORF type:complete len:151 (-),score=21.26 TRINITY_DN37473_c0_g1_i1:78-530(-)